MRGLALSMHSEIARGSRFAYALIPTNHGLLSARKPPYYGDIPQDQVAAVLAEFEAIGDSAERFRAFVSAIEKGTSQRKA